MRGIQVVFALALLLGAACGGLQVRPGPPIERGASRALQEALEARRQAPGSAEAGLAAAREAAALAPDWVAPARFEDESLRQALRGPEVLARRRAAVQERPDDGAALYLLGRLGGPDAPKLLDRAAERAPRCGWTWHGLAWNAHRASQSARAVELGRAALALARDPHERAHFGLALSSYLRARRDGEGDARALLRELLRPDGSELALRGGEREALAVELALLELEAEEPATRARGTRDALALIASPLVVETERLRLVAALGAAPDATRDELVLALSAVRGEAAGALRGELMAVDGGGPYAERLAGERRAAGASMRVRLARAFAAGEPTDALDAWMAELPSWTLDDRGLPRRAELAEVVRTTRAAAPLAQAASHERAAAAEALVAAGWFEEALGLVERGALDEVHATEVQRRALAARTGLAAVAQLLIAVDRGEPTELARDAAGRRDVLRRIGGLGDLLRAVQQRLSDRRLLAGLDPRLEDLDARSPRIHYGPFAEVVHPGPTFSAEDARLGRGAEGAPVPGLAAEFARLGRLALFGVALGQGGPDGAVLRLVHVERRAGEHLGRPFGGEVFWCQGADVPARFARAGASISGAALHEGYWVDLESVEREQRSWARVADTFAGAPARARAALDVRPARAAGAARAAALPSLGANDRLRLAVMVERGSTEEPEVVSLEELAAVVAAHEEGHLCDRRAWYPLGEHLGAVLGLVLHYRFDAGRIAEVLEERAQLTALCVAPDPRLALVDLLDAAERSGPAVTPHAAGYRRVLEDLLRRLAEEVDAGAWPELADDARLVDQLHRVAPERLRALAEREARARGLDLR